MGNDGEGVGGRRWLIWFVLALALATVHFHRVSVSVVADQLMAQFGATAVQLGTMGSIYFYIYALMQLPAGICSDRLGPGKTVTGGLVVMGVGSILFGLAPSLALVYGTRLLVGLGSAVIWVSMLKVMTYYFASREFGTISGLSSLMGHGGQLLASAPLAILVALGGWRLPFWGVGVLTLVLAVVTWRMVPREREEKETCHQGLWAGFWENLRVVCRNPANWIVFIIFFGLLGSINAMVGLWGVPYLMQVYGMAREKAAGLMSVLIMGKFCGGPVSGFVSDRLGRRQLPTLFFVSGHVLTWALLVLFFQSRPPGGLLAPLFFTMGFFNGISVQVFALVKELNPSRIIGSAVGLVNSGGFVATAISQPLMGYLLDRGWEGVLVQGVRIYPVTAFRHALFLPFFLACLSLGACILLQRGNYSQVETRSAPAVHG